MDRIDEKPDEQLVGMLDEPAEWLIHCVGLKAVSGYSLREALVEGHRIAATAHVIQRIRLPSGAITIEAEQIARLWSRCGETPD
ncbi:MAG TPA: hypothetical protein VMQ73_07330 [Methylomirabilota bacterium]|nr:hypothetical protein [Methylomirabilota bacterium]